MKVIALLFASANLPRLDTAAEMPAPTSVPTAEPIPAPTPGATETAGHTRFAGGAPDSTHAVAP